MSHIHFPDGVLPFWLWAAGYGLAVLLVALLWHGGQATVQPRQFARLGIFTALMILVMTIEIPVVSYHFNLSVASAIILGPQLSVLAAFIVNVMLSLLGHGGITVVGLNTLTISTEMLVGYAVFRLCSRLRVPLAPAGFLATLCGLAAGTAAGFGIVALGAPWINRTLQTAQLAPGTELAPGVTGTHLDLTRLALLMFGIGAIGWIIEGKLTSVIISYLNRMNPELFGGGE